MESSSTSTPPLYAGHRIGMILNTLFSNEEGCKPSNCNNAIGAMGAWCTRYTIQAILMLLDWTLYGGWSPPSLQSQVPTASTSLHPVLHPTLPLHPRQQAYTSIIIIYIDSVNAYLRFTLHLIHFSSCFLHDREMRVVGHRCIIFKDAVRKAPSALDHQMH